MNAFFRAVLFGGMAIWLTASAWTEALASPGEEHPSFVVTMACPDMTVENYANVRSLNWERFGNFDRNPSLMSQLQIACTYAYQAYATYLSVVEKANAQFQAYKKNAAAAGMIAPKGDVWVKSNYPSAHSALSNVWASASTVSEICLKAFGSRCVGDSRTPPRWLVDVDGVLTAVVTTTTPVTVTNPVTATIPHNATPATPPVSLKCEAPMVPQQVKNTESRLIWVCGIPA